MFWGRREETTDDQVIVEVGGLEERVDLTRMAYLGEYREGGSWMRRGGSLVVGKLPHGWGHGGKGMLVVGWTGCSVWND